MRPRCRRRQIYNEKIKDLLNPSDANLDVREVPSKGTYVAGATDKTVTRALASPPAAAPPPQRPPSLAWQVTHPREMLELMHEGNLYRTTEATKVNEVSSRSHAVLQLSVHAKPRYGEGKGKLGKLSMIDLAGR